MNQKLKKQVSKLPLKPGVYKFIDAKGNILYIGRATLIKRRVAQYFQNNISTRIAEMVHSASQIEFEVTETILDSVILEANLIRKYWPKYNIKDKDDKSLSYIIISREDFPKVLMVRGKDLENFPQPLKKFGPYKNSQLTRKALKIIRKIFPYSTCKPSSGKACFDYKIMLCPGTCIGAIDKKEYKKNIDNIILLLSGKKQRLLKRLLQDNPQQVQQFKNINDIALAVNDDLNSSNFNRIEGYDISHLTGREPYGSLVVFTDGKPDKAQYRLFKIKNQAESDDLRALGEVLTRRFNHPEWHTPDLIMIDGGRPQIDFISNLFTMHSIHVPFVGISKYKGDKLVFPKKANAAFKNLAKINKQVLLQLRDEAHRFALSASRRKRKIKSN